jgi:hypothetical protein
MSKQCGRCGERAALRRPKTQEQVSKSMLPYDLLIFACNCMLYIRNSAIMQKLLFLAAQWTDSENFNAAAAAAAAAAAVRAKHQLAVTTACCRQT